MCVHVGNTERGWRVRHEKDQFVRQIFLIFGNATYFLIISSYFMRFSLVVPLGGAHTHTHTHTHTHVYIIVQQLSRV